MVTDLHQTPNTGWYFSAVRQWGISFIVERETAQTDREGPEVAAKWKRKYYFINSQEVGSEAAIL